MPLITWDDSYSVQIVKLDHQHQRLVGMINDLHQAMLQGTARENMGKTIADLLEYAQKHFADEEALLTQYGFPEAEAHKSRHAEFVAQVTQFQESIASRHFSLSITVMQFLFNWVRTHIKGTDQKYVPFLTAKGVR